LNWRVATPRPQANLDGVTSLSSPRLARAARRALSSPASSVFVSAISIWGIAIKLSIGKLKWKAPPDVTLDQCIPACGFVELPVTAQHAAGVRDLPPHHGDPFDRMLLSQAIAEELRIVTADATFGAYGVPLVAAED
jgi:PIN domain nuclease of toxin-antitoxin system